MMQTEPHMKSVLNSLSIPAEAKLRKNDLVEELRVSTGAKTLESCLYKFDQQMAEENKISYAWFITDAHGTQLARCRRNDNTLGTNFAWRSYFYGGASDQPDDLAAGRRRAFAENATFGGLPQHRRRARQVDHDDFRPRL